jgi:hypothetical protein
LPPGCSSLSCLVAPSSFSRCFASCTTCCLRGGQPENRSAGGSSSQQSTTTQDRPRLKRDCRSA